MKNYYFGMIKTLHEILAINVQALMEHFDLKQEMLSAKSGVGQTTISNVLCPGRIKSIRTDTIEKLAEYFELEPYHLLIPNLPIEELLNKRIERVVNFYANTNKDGRENIERIAENEMRYCVLSKPNDDSKLG